MPLRFHELYRTKMPTEDLVALGPISEEGGWSFARLCFGNRIRAS